MLGPGVDTAAPSAPPRPRHVGERGPRGAGLSPTAPVQATPGDTQTQAHKVKKGRERLRGPRGQAGCPGGGGRRAPGATGTKSRRSPAEEAPRFPVCPRASPLTPRVPVCPCASPCVPARPPRSGSHAPPPGRGSSTCFLQYRPRVLLWTVLLCRIVIALDPALWGDESV